MYPKEFGSRCWRLGNWPRPGRNRGGTRACGAGPADGREIERYVLFFKGDGPKSSVVGLISVFVMGYTGCYLCTLCALWCCHATILIDKLVASCHANMFNFSESIKPKSLHPGNSSIDQLDTMCCIGRAYVELATPRLFLQMRLFQSFLYSRNAHN